MLHVYGIVYLNVSFSCFDLGSPASCKVGRSSETAWCGPYRRCQASATAAAEATAAEATAAAEATKQSVRK